MTSILASKQTEEHHGMFREKFLLPITATNVKKDTILLHVFDVGANRQFKLYRWDFSIFGSKVAIFTFGYMLIWAEVCACARVCEI